MSGRPEMFGKDHTRLSRLLSGHCEGVLSDAEEAELARLLDESAEARRLYIWYVDMHEELRSEAETMARPNMRVTTATQHRRAPMRRAMYAAAAAAAIAAGVTIAIMANRQRTGGGDATKPTVASVTGNGAALLTDVHDAVWAPDSTVDQHTQLGATLEAGRAALSAGSAQMMLRSGAVVTLHGPCDYELTAENRGVLEGGELEAFVPKKAAGFAVDTPVGLRVTDLGTRFDLRVKPGVLWRLHVQQGHVRVDATQTSLPAALRDAIGDAGRTLGAADVMELAYAQGHAPGAADTAAPPTPVRVRFARAIDVVNPSFEVDDRELRQATPSGWTTNVPARIFIHSHDSHDAHVVSGYTGRFVGTINSSTPSLGDPRGVEPALIQQLDAKVEAGVHYELTVAVGRRSDYDKLHMPPTRWRIELDNAATGKPLAALAGDPPPAGSLVDHTLAYTPKPGDIGQPLEIRLINPMHVTQPGDGKIIFDNVRLLRFDDHAPAADSSPHRQQPASTIQP